MQERNMHHKQSHTLEVMAGNHPFLPTPKRNIYNLSHDLQVTRTEMQRLINYMYNISSFNSNAQTCVEIYR